MEGLEGLITGIVVGFIASKIYSGSGKGCLINLLLGIVGGWVGGRLFSWCGITATGLVGNIVMAVVGAIVVLWLWNKLT